MYDGRWNSVEVWQEELLGKEEEIREQVVVGRREGMCFGRRSSVGGLT